MLTDDNKKKSYYENLPMQYRDFLGCKTENFIQENFCLKH